MQRHVIQEFAGGELAIATVSPLLELAAIELRRDTIAGGPVVALLALEQLDEAIAALREVRDELTAEVPLEPVAAGGQLP